MVEAIEPVLPFWEKLGFEKQMEVPHEGRLGFVGLGSGPVEVMYQTVASIRADVPPMGGMTPASAFLFIEVEDLDAIERALEGVALVVPRRKTFYGSEELIVRDPAGNGVTFAYFAAS
jgi:hypothetical protein